MKRLFLAWDLSEPARRALAGSVAWMNDFNGRMSVVSPGHYHITVKFLGAVPPERIPDIVAAAGSAVRGLTPALVGVHGRGVFPEIGHPAVFWAGVEPAGSLEPAFARCEAALEPLGFAPEKRAFAAHVTLARASRERRAPVEFLQRWESLDPLEGPLFTADRITLYESVPAAHGPDYRPLADLPL